jgi:cellulose synthase/poly-beta-1,6-N-acetylglucosamine synthase-like glycosyltransferase
MVLAMSVSSIDVILLTYYDDKEVLNRTITSIHKAFEIAKEFFKLKDFIIIGEEVKGRGKARDVGWRKGKSEFVLFVDTGVILSNYWLKEMYKAEKKIGGDVWYGDGSKAINPESLIAKSEEIEYIEDHNRLVKQGSYTITRGLNTSSCLFRRKALEEVDGFDINLPFNEDCEIGYRIWKNGGKIVYVSNAKSKNTHRTKFWSKIKRSWEGGKGLAYNKCKHREYPINWIMYLLLPYSCCKRFFIWGLQYGWKGSASSIIYFFSRITVLAGYFYGRLYRIKKIDH